MYLFEVEEINLKSIHAVLNAENSLSDTEESDLPDQSPMPISHVDIMNKIMDDIDKLLEEESYNLI